MHFPLRSRGYRGGRVGVRELDGDYIKPIYSQKCDCQLRSTSRSLSTRTRLFVVIKPRHTQPLIFFHYYFSVLKYNYNAILKSVILFQFPTELMGSFVLNDIDVRVRVRACAWACAN